MFSEYASRFLAQSQSRLSLGQPEQNTDTMNTDRRFRPSPQRPGSRSYLQRQTMANPYQTSGSQFSRFPFALRTQAREAPLFYSATDEFREEDDAEEHEREVADYYALQRSRAHFTSEKLSGSSDIDDDAHSGSEEGRRRKENALSHHYSGGRGIRSSWRGDRPRGRGRPATVKESVAEMPEREQSTAQSETTQASKGKGKLVDVELESSRRSSMESLDRVEAESALQDDDDEAPAFQNFRNSPRAGIAREHQWIPGETDEETARLNPRPPSPDRESVPDVITSDVIEPPRHDQFWASLFWIALASLFATSFLVYLHTDPPSGKKPLGDTVYTVLHKSFHLLAVDTLVAVIVSAIWLALLRSAIRPLTYFIIIAVPIILFSFSLYPLISSYKGYWNGTRLQDKAMRIFAFIPLAGTFTWCYLAVKARHSIDKAINILEFACKILASSPALVFAGFATQLATIIWFWIWLLMFTRVFLEGHWSASAKGLFVLDLSTWWLGIYFVLMLLWTLSVISGVQRATSAATTSQWYFHRNATPAPSSRQVVQASFQHASTTLLGTICESSFLAVAVRLPILILPRRIVAVFTLCFYSIVPSPLAALINPLTLTYAAIHSQPLAVAARQLGNLSFISRTEATTTLSPTSVNAPPADALVQYRTAKLILHATRYMMTLAMGFGGWVSTARLIHVDPGYSGSLYAYVVGLGAAAIGWSVLGAMEGIVVGVVDGVVVCWGSEVGAGGLGVGRGRYCWEAGELFGDGGRDGGIRV